MRIRPLALVFVLGCAHPASRPISYGQDTCSHCHMAVADPRFGAELVTPTGRVFVFDDVGCLAGYYVEGRIEASRVHSLWVNDFAHPEALLDATTAVFLHTDSLRTPMASGLAALRPGTEADSVRAVLGGRLLSWEEVLVEARAAPGHHPRRPGPPAVPGSPPA